MNDDHVADRLGGGTADDDLPPMLRSAVGELDAPDVEGIRRRGRRLAALRAGAVGGGVAVLIAGVVGAGLAMGTGEGPGLPLIDDPPAEDAAPDDATDACPPPNLWPTALPWLAEGEDVPPPDLVRYGTDDEPNGLLVWAADPQAFDPEGFSDTHLVAVARLHDHEPVEGDVPEVEVRGHTARRMWIGDPGVGELQLAWSEGDGPCDTYAVALTILAPRGDEEEREEGGGSFGFAAPQPEREPGEDEHMYLQRAIEDHIDRVAASLVEGASAEAADPARVLPVPPRGEVTARFVGDHPVFVVHEAAGAVRVLDAEMPSDGPFPKVVAYCRSSGWFEDPWHGSRFDERGDWTFGPAPGGLAPYDVAAVDGGRLVVGDPRGNPPRPSDDREFRGPRGPMCSERTPLGGPGVRYEEGVLDDLVVHDPSEVGRSPGEEEGDLWFPTRERVRGELPRGPDD